jgi:hypothetical protein
MATGLRYDNRWRGALVGLGVCMQAGVGGAVDLTEVGERVKHTDNGRELT